jgi:multidrug efflux system outer membrane protein
VRSIVAVTTAASNTLAQIRRNRLLPYAQLYKALGGGWKLTDTEWPGPAAAVK